MPDFTGHEQITLRPGALGVPVTWRFAAASSAVANDGSLPFGATIATADVTIYDADGTDVTASILAAGSVQVSGGLSVMARLNHLGTTITQRCTAVVTCTLSTGAVIPFDCRRILVDGVTG